ncbi:MULTISPECIES: hypothetical protein [unclassified Caballeronia]|uniref:hypothetical protein n=1 Tax=unclassified Caballeronia TaxID=2646786 RepID=UPI00158ACEB4|nr:MULTISPECIES: hypothetical protein [unclassified Caballeronia]QSN60626.1 hypothetical protein JYK05_09690 [Caballeronia sp. M1242]
MTEPLIAIEGKLRLPPLRPIADPSLTFGREWSPVRSRPVRSDSEVPISAARFETAYVEAARLSDASSPYRAASLWGVFSEGQIRRKMLQLMQATEPSAAHGKEAPAGAAPIPIAVSAPAVEHNRAAASHKPLRTVIAIACAALIAWLLFGYQRRPASDEPAALASAAAPVQSTPPARVETTRIVAHAASAVEAKVVAGEPVPASAVQAASHVDNSAAQPNASTINVRHAGMKWRSVARAGSPAPSPSPSPVKASRRQAHARVAASTAHGKRASHVATARGRQITARTGEPRHNAITSATNAKSPTNAMNVEALYAVLQHSPTLDSNAVSRADHRSADAPSN